MDVHPTDAASASAMVIGRLDPAVADCFRQAWLRVVPDGVFEVAGSNARVCAAARRLDAEYVVLSSSALRDEGLDVLEDLAAECGARVFVHGEPLNAMTIAHGLHYGLRGVFEAEADVGTIERALHATRSGEVWLSRRRLADVIFAHGAGDGCATSEAWRRLACLSARQHDMLLEVLAGSPNKRIASKFAISEHTVKAHMQQLFLKLGLHSRVDLLRAYLPPHTNNP